jgi:hypothetical protein
MERILPFHVQAARQVGDRACRDGEQNRHSHADLLRSRILTTVMRIGFRWSAVTPEHTARQMARGMIRCNICRVVVQMTAPFRRGGPIISMIRPGRHVE